MVQIASENVIDIVGLKKIFKDFWMRPRVTAVDDLNLSVKAHEIFGLLGPNGSGKSTTIKIILGLLFPSAGRVAVFGRLPTDVAIKKRIGYLPEESYLYRFLNARETLDYYGRLFHIERHKRVKRIDALLEMVGLDAVQRRPVGEFSKGMQRRIGLAQALINDPDLLILDEPTTGLDPIGTRQIKDIILELKHRGKTVVLSSHLLADVEDVCDRVTILYGGKKRAEGTCDQLLRVEDCTRIETDKLDDATVTKIDELLRRDGKAIRACEAPRQKLEQLFLDIVHRAQAEGARTSGARTGGAVAEFLARDAHLPEDVDGRALIDQLVSTDTSIADPAKAKLEPEKVEPVRSVIDDLTAPAASSDVVEPQDVDDDGGRGEPDRGVIDDLLGGGGKS
ncbi:MAG: ATP-binding cassette domain-containing protein [Planctomycetes bacterium]|nr:ATP-binding cassette domain-containing protein [Planctomycetota bacterium]